MPTILRMYAHGLYNMHNLCEVVFACLLKKLIYLYFDRMANYVFKLFYFNLKKNLL